MDRHAKDCSSCLADFVSAGTLPWSSIVLQIFTIVTCSEITVQFFLVRNSTFYGGLKKL